MWFVVCINLTKDGQFSKQVYISDKICQVAWFLFFQSKLHYLQRCKECYRQCIRLLSGLEFAVLFLKWDDFKGIVHFEIIFWYVLAYLKGIQDVCVFVSTLFSYNGGIWGPPMGPPLRACTEKSKWLMTLMIHECKNTLMA